MATPRSGNPSPGMKQGAVTTGQLRSIDASLHGTTSPEALTTPLSPLGDGRVDFSSNNRRNERYFPGRLQQSDMGIRNSTASSTATTSESSYHRFSDPGSIFDPRFSAATLDTEFSSPTPSLRNSSANQTVPYTCDFCPKVFYGIHDWRAHEIEFHEMPWRWECPEGLCGRVFYLEKRFRQHHKEIHGCEECTKSRNSASYGGASNRACAHEAKRENCHKRVWACGYCGTLLNSLEERFSHIADHYEQGISKDQWSFTTMICSLLQQDNVFRAWRGLLAQNFVPSGWKWRQFRWDHLLNTGKDAIELLHSLEQGSDSEEDSRTLAQKAFQAAEQVQLNDMPYYNEVIYKSPRKFLTKSKPPKKGEKQENKKKARQNDSQLSGSPHNGQHQLHSQNQTIHSHPNCPQQRPCAFAHQNLVYHGQQLHQEQLEDSNTTLPHLPDIPPTEFEDIFNGLGNQPYCHGVSDLVIENVRNDTIFSECSPSLRSMNDYQNPNRPEAYPSDPLENLDTEQVTTTPYYSM